MFEWKTIVKQITSDSLVAAVFITPGMIVSATLSGATFGFSILWAVVLATASNIILQEMHLRLSLVTEKNIIQNIKHEISNRFLRYLLLGILSMVSFASATIYIAGNISAVQLGIYYFFPNLDIMLFFILCGIFLIAFSSYFLPNIIEKCIIAGLMLISLLFIVSAFKTHPNLLSMVQGAFLPFSTMDSSEWKCVLSLMGSTVIPYQLFLTTCYTKERYENLRNLTVGRVNIVVTSVITGAIVGSIILCASHIYGRYTTLSYTVNSLSELMTLVLDKPLGLFAFSMCFCGLASASLTAIYLARLFGAFFTLNGIAKRIVMTLISYLSIIIAVLYAYLANRSMGVNILYSQIFNVVFLPFIICMLLYLMNHRMMKNHCNGFVENLLLVCLLAMSCIMTQRVVHLLIESLDSIWIQISNLLPL